MSAPPLVAHGLGKRFRREWGLRDLTLTIPAGAVVGLAGPNAAGKSTLLSLAAGVLAPSEGSIAVLGHDPLASPRFSPRSATSPRERRFTAPSGSQTRSSTRVARTRAGTTRSPWNC